MQPYPNLRHIRLFEAAVDLASLSRAAEAVHISQPAASQAISRLEVYFGGLLLHRQGARVSPTERGTVVARRARRSLELLRSASANLARQSRIGKGLAMDLLEVHATITQLRAIAAFADTGTFLGAARLLGQAEPSVQRAARQLERIVRVPLFDGAYRSLRLTPAGAMLASHAHLILRELDSAGEEVREIDGRFDGRIVVGTLPLVRTKIIPAAIAKLSALRPEASIEILDGDYDSLIAALMTGKIDLLIGALRRSTLDKRLVEETLFSDGLSIIARADHPLRQKREITHEDLARYPWVLPRRGTPTRAIFEVLAERFPPGATPSGNIVTGSLVAVRGILLQTDRLTILSRQQIEYDEKAGLLGVVPFGLPQSERPIGMTLRSNWEPTALQRDFIAALREAVAEAAAGGMPPRPIEK
ncbi:LysR family transcriptional regulator [Chelativorans sp. AA-79]|uniref:LysR family transcriptional regulator n=1 Tax=Chelativorans sp. AA-79 TaxID=3028735 RepID=UPI0023F7A78A|nr:LysR family transcriptional regulator [Chelativorans sp. AA-79]WEX10539.1 LysR family transcriptional regulator [Chelativorans sp. AA-79]